MDTDIRIGARRITPLFDLVAWRAIEEEMGDIHKLLEQLDSEDSAIRRKATISAARILANNAIEARMERAQEIGVKMTDEERRPITERQLERATPPKRVPDLRHVVILAINKGMKCDYDAADEEPVDVVLEEIAKKRNPDG
ncbi:MAG: hypothetical protein J6K32_12940 [Clostridia bacterium]|nr:hypothetical protein [Clostridia bacterium]